MMLRQNLIYTFWNVLSYPKNSKKFKCVLFSSLVTKINKNKNKKPLILLNRIENWLKKKKKRKEKENWKVKGIKETFVLFLIGTKKTPHCGPGYFWPIQYIVSINNLLMFPL